MEKTRQSQPVTRSAVDELLHVVQQLNLRYLRGLLANAELPLAATRTVVTEETLERLSAYPILLADLHFCDVRWWREAIARRDAVTPSLDAKVLATFDVIMGAWRCVRPGAFYELSFGMAPAVCELMLTLSAHDIARIAYQASPGLVPRWSTNAIFWDDLFATVESGDADAWRAGRLHGLQLLGRDLARAANS
jgi:hypothetical protein